MRINLNIPKQQRRRIGLWRHSVAVYWSVTSSINTFSSCTDFWLNNSSTESCLFILPGRKYSACDVNSEYRERAMNQSADGVISWCDAVLPWHRVTETCDAWTIQWENNRVTQRTVLLVEVPDKGIKLNADLNRSRRKRLQKDVGNVMYSGPLRRTEGQWVKGWWIASTKAMLLSLLWL